ncbi:MAG: class A beta-lactamase-related serine hydrolase, partial [Comamonadaceae bacterium]
PGCGGGHAQAPAPVNAACLPNARRPVASTDPAKAAAIRAIALDTIKTRHARAVLIRATVDGQEILTEAFGESGDGEPATVDMHFRNGSVAIALVSMLLLILVDEGRVSLDAKVGRWLPDLPHGDRVTLRHLSQMTAGYADYVRDADFLAANLADPYRVWQPQELIAFAVRRPLFFEPGTNWAYSHTDYVILGLAIERITGRPMHELMQDKVLGPLCMTHTTDPRSPAITAPVLRAFTGERRAALGIAPGQPFYEESTLWDPSWTITQGAVQVTDLYDLHTSAIAFGSGLLLSPASHAAQVSTSLRGRTTFVDGCPTCFPHSERYAFGLGVVLKGNWILQPPLFGGYSAVAAYHEGRRVAIAAAVTYAPSAVDDDGEYRLGNESETLFGSIARVLLPEDPPPARVPG